MSSQGKNEESENRPNPPQSITVGDVTNSIGVAIGDGASSTVIVHNHYAATRKRPDYLNLAPKIDYFLERPTQYDALKTLLINPNQDAVAISATALRGAGGFGKTTLAQALCYDLDIQNNFSDGILWVELGEKPDNIPGKINDLIYHLTDINPGFVDQNNAAAELENALAGKKCLLVIDDLWNPVHATPFLRGGSTTTHLRTTIMTHCNTIINCYCIEFSCKETILIKKLLNILTNLMQMRMSGNKLCKGIYNCNNRFTYLFLLHAVCSPEAPGASHTASLGSGITS
jgi:hypothetical protein